MQQEICTRHFGSITMEEQIQLDKTAIVIIETKDGDKAPVLRYVKIGGIGGFYEEEMIKDALDAVDGEFKRVVKIVQSDSELYRQYLEKDLIDYARSKKD